MCLLWSPEGDDQQQQQSTIAKHDRVRTPESRPKFNCCLLMAGVLLLLPPCLFIYLYKYRFSLVM